MRDFARDCNGAWQKVQHQHNKEGGGMDHPAHNRAAYHRVSIVASRCAASFLDSQPAPACGLWRATKRWRCPDRDPVGSADTSHVSARARRRRHTELAADLAGQTEVDLAVAWHDRSLAVWPGPPRMAATLVDLVAS